MTDYGTPSLNRRAAENAKFAYEQEIRKEQLRPRKQTDVIDVLLKGLQILAEVIERRNKTNPKED